MTTIIWLLIGTLGPLGLIAWDPASLRKPMRPSLAQRLEPYHLTPYVPRHRANLPSTARTE